MAERSPESSQVRVAGASRSSESNERTNGRTDVAPNTDCTSPELSARARAYKADDIDVVSLQDVLAAGIAGSGQRYERIRQGEREPIPYHVRAAVWLRDRGICQKCYLRDVKPWHLDHITPWSAGGSDRSDNLRVLCEPCNVERSNYDDGTGFAKRPVTWWCHRCYSDPVRWDYSHPFGIYCPTHRHDWNDFAKSCHVERIYRWQHKNGEKPDWHRRPPVETTTTTAYCAHCRAPGETDQPL